MWRLRDEAKRLVNIRLKENSRNASSAPTVTISLEQVTSGVYILVGSHGARLGFFGEKL